MIMADEIHKILVVADEQLGVKLIADTIKSDGYLIDSAPDSVTAFQKIKEFKPDIILLNVMLPDITGQEILRKLKASAETRNIPVIMGISLSDKNSKYEALSNGADDFLNIPFDISELRIRIRNSLKVKAYNDLRTNYDHTLEKNVKEKTEELNEVLKNLHNLNAALRNAYLDTVFILTRAVEYKDEFTGQHLKRISAYSSTLGEYMNLSKAERETIIYASPMHDIGKIGIPDHILGKKGSLTKEEFEIIKQHTTIGGALLKDSASTVLKIGRQIALTHHERWDGSGYPVGLKGTQIPLIGRIVMLADQYDALRSKRPYKHTLSHEQTYDIITKGDGRTLPEHFDPDLLEVFKKYSDRLEGIYNYFKEEEAGVSQEQSDSPR